MACALPVITTTRCMAGVEMIDKGENGFIVPADSYKEALEIIKDFIHLSPQVVEMMSKKCL